MAWELFYANGRTVCSCEGSPEDAPLDGLQVIIERTPTNRTVIQGHDYFIWLGENWAGGSQMDLDRWIRAGYVSPGRVKFGLWINEGKYRQIADQAMAEGCDGCAD